MIRALKIQFATMHSSTSWHLKAFFYKFFSWNHPQYAYKRITILHFSYLTLVRMALLVPLCRMAKTFKCPCSASSPADPNIVSEEDANKLSKSQQLIDSNKRYIQLLLFWFYFLDLLIKFMKMRLLYILYCPPYPCHVPARIF